MKKDLKSTYSPQIFDFITENNNYILIFPLNYRLRIEEVEEIIIDSITLRPNDTVDFWFTNIHQNFTMKGALDCPLCGNATKDEKVTKPRLNLHVIKSGSMVIDNFEKYAQTDLNLKFRDADSLTIMDSYFENMTQGTVEVFNIPSVYLMHSEFHDSSPNIIVTNAYVKNVTIVDCLLEEDAVNILANQSTKVTKKCTISPIITANSVLAPECQHTSIGRWVAINSQSAVETTGAISLALVSSFILMIVILTLYTFHRQGKLDAYL